MSKTYAVIENGMVVNVIIWDGKTSMGWGGDQLTIQIAQSGVGTSTPMPGIGWSYENGVFTPPPSPPLTPENIAAKNLALAQVEYNLATAKITALNEQIADADYAGTTEAEVNADLIAWTNYRKNLRAYIKENDGSKDLPVASA